MIENIGMRSLWSFKQYREGKLIDEWEIHNVVPDEFLNAGLNILFYDGTPIITSWYTLLFESNTEPSSTTTYLAPGWTESTASYSPSTRPQYITTPSSNQTISNNVNPIVFTFNTSNSIYGAAIVGGGSAASTKGDTAGGGLVAFAAKFSAVKNVENEDTLTVLINIISSSL